MVTEIWLYLMLRTISSLLYTFWVNPITSKGFYEVQILQCRIWNWCRKNGCRGRIIKICNLVTSHECRYLVRKWKVLWSWGAQFSAWWRRKLQIVQCKSWSPRTGLDVIGYFQHAFIIDIWGKIDCYVLIKVTMSLDNGLFKLRDYVRREGRYEDGKGGNGYGMWRWNKQRHTLFSSQHNPFPPRSWSFVI